MQQLTYKGKNLDEIMTRIASKHGESVRIVAVDKSRSGGILGFFQREEHLLVAEVDETRPQAGPLEPETVFPAPVSTTFQAAELDREPLGLFDDPQLAYRPQVRYESRDASEQTMQPAYATAAQSVEELLMNQAEQTEDVFEITSVPHPPKSFDEALESVTGSLGFQPEPVALDHLDTSMLWAESAMENLEVERPETKAKIDDPSGRSALMRQLRSAGYPARMLAELASHGVEEATLKRAFSIIPEARALPATRGGLVVVVGPEERAIEMATLLVAQLNGNDTTLALVTQRSTPPTPPRGARLDRPSNKSSKKRPKEVRASEEFTIDPSESRFEPGFIARSLEEIADLSGGWRRDCIGVVAVACDMKVTSYPWVRSMLKALSPTYVSLVTRATTKARDLDMISALIGGVDSLLVDGLGETMTPLSALDSSIPVARLDGQVATAGTWMAAFEAIPSFESEA